METNLPFDFLNEMETNSPSVKVETETNSQRPLIYTTRLEDMSIFLQDFGHLSCKEINECIERESKPLFKNRNNQTTDLELQRLFYINMLEKLINYKLNINNNVDKLNDDDDECTVTELDTKKLSEEKNKIKIDISTRELQTLATCRKADTKNCTQNLNRANNNVITENITQMSSDDDDDLITVNELRISKRNRLLLDLCKPVEVVLQDIGKTLTGNQIQKLKPPTGQFIVPNEGHLKTNGKQVHKLLIPIAPRPKPLILFKSMNDALAHTSTHPPQLQPIKLPTSTKIDTIPILPSKCYQRQQPKHFLLPPQGYSWSPYGVYLLFHDLRTEETEAHFVDNNGHPKEYYKFDRKSTKEIEKFITSQKCMKLDCCCWHRREAYIQCMSRFISVQTALLFKKPHKCQINKCTCCCKMINCESNEASSMALNVTESQVESLQPDSNENGTRQTIEKPDYIQELLLSKSTDSNSLINRALRFDGYKQLRKVFQTPMPTKTFKSRSFETQSGLNIINSRPESTKVNIKIAINGSNEIYIQDPIEKVTLHTIDVGHSISEHSVLTSDQEFENICCWYKLQLLCDKFYLPLSFSTAKHSCPPENCCCCCSYKPEIKIQKPRLVDIHLPARVWHGMLNCSKLLYRNKYLPENSQLTSTASETTDNSILTQGLNTPNSSGLERNKLSCPLNNMSSVKDYIDKVIVDCLVGPNNKRKMPLKKVNSKNPSKKVNSKNPPKYATPEALHAGSPPEAWSKVFTSVNTSVKTESNEPHQTMYVSSTPITPELCSNSSIQTSDPTCYPIITNVFSVAPPPADVSNATTPNITAVYNKPYTDASPISDVRASTSKGLPQTCTIDSQEKIVESVISTVMEKFKYVRLTINEDGKVAAALSTPVHTLNTAELKILGNILSHAQSYVETLKSIPGSNINNLIKEPPFAAAMNTVNIPSSTNNTPITTADPIQKSSSQPTQSFPFLIPVVPEGTTQTIYGTLSTEMGKKVKDYSKSFTSFITLKTQTKHTPPSLPKVSGRKRKMEHVEPEQPKIRVISPEKLGAPSARIFMNKSSMEDEEIDESSNVPGISNEDFESQISAYSVPVINQNTKNTALQLAQMHMETESVIDNESIKE